MGGDYCCDHPLCMDGICKAGTVPQSIMVTLAHNGQIDADSVCGFSGPVGEESMLQLAGSSMILTLVYSNGAGKCVWAAKLCDIDAENGLFALLSLVTSPSTPDGYFVRNRYFTVFIHSNATIDSMLASGYTGTSFNSIIYTPNTPTVPTEYSTTRPYQLIDCRVSGPVYGSMKADDPDGFRVIIDTRPGNYTCCSDNSDIIVSPVSEGTTANCYAICDYASSMLNAYFGKWYENCNFPASVMVEFNLTATFPSDDHVVDHLNGTHACDWCMTNNFAAYYRCDFWDGAEFRVMIGRSTCTSTYYTYFVLGNITASCGTTYLSGSIGGGNAPGSGCSATIPCDILSNHDSWWYGINRSSWYFSGTATVSF